MKLGEIMCNEISCRVKVKILLRNKEIIARKGKTVFYTTVAFPRGTQITKDSILTALQKRYSLAFKEQKHKISTLDNLTYLIEDE